MDSIDYLDPETIGGTNLYAYCNNNPVMCADPSGHSAILAGLIIGAIVGAGIGFGTVAYTDYQDDGQIFNGSVEWYDYLGATTAGGILGGVIGAGIGYIAPAISSALSSLGSSLTVGSVALGSGGTAEIALTGSLILGIVGMLGISLALIGKSGGYRIEHHYPNDHNPTHVHISGDDGMTKVDVNGNPIQGNRPMTHGEKKAFKKLFKKIIEALMPWN